MRDLFLFIVFSVVFKNTYSQYQLAASFSIKEGLPSNSVYRCLEDDKGFLWLGTDQGVMRFDGSRFQKFTIDQGLPDNDAYILLKEMNGRIWVKCINNKVAYFDMKKNRFVNAKMERSLSELQYKSITTPFTLSEGGIYFPNYDTSYLCKELALIKYPMFMKDKRNFIVVFNKEGSETRLAIDTLRESHFHLYHTRMNRIIESRVLERNDGNTRCYVDDGRLYLFNSESNKVVIISEITSNPLQFKRDTLMLSNNYYWHNFSKKFLMMLNENGGIHIYNKNTLRKEEFLHSSTLPFSAYNDANENFWVSTKDKGLLLYQKRKINKVELVSPLNNTSWSCLTKNQKGALLLGNTTGEILESAGNQNKVYRRKQASNTDILRSIIISQNKVFTFGEGGIYVNYTKQLKAKYNACKVAYALNDSIILCGFLKGMCKVNTKSEKITELNNREMEVTSFASIDGNTIYFGSTDGLHKFSLIQNTLDTPINTIPLLQERIVAMTSRENQLWIATASNGIVVVSNDKIMYHVTEAQGLRTNNLLAIASGRNRQIWVGSSNGISIINYNNLNPSIQNISIKDGLTSNVINQFCFQNDTMYAATDNGVSLIPANISIPKFDIPIELTAVRINNVDTILASHYELKPNQYIIDIEFSGVELSGHFKNAQISRDEGQTWADVNNYNISLQIGSGKHLIWLRAVDVNGNVGTKILNLQFDIQKRFYEEWWFWFIITLVILIASIYFNTIISRRKHQRNIEKFLDKQKLDEFEIQALKAQINPHFVFNCLNSIRGLIYEEDLENADLYLQKFSTLLRSTLNYSSKASISLKAELEYIDTYLLMEKLRFENKFEYSIHCDENLNKDRIEIPAMLLQPFVENAINHGVRNLKGVLGIITINIYLADNIMKVVIDDNGVGRLRSNEIRQNKFRSHESKGMQITQRRIELHQINLSITDKTNEKGEASGTTVTLKIPIPLISL